MKIRNLLAFFVLFVIVFACSDDEEEVKAPYYGSWKTPVLHVSDKSTAATDDSVYQYYVFDLKNKSFETKVYSSYDQVNYALSLGVKGAIQDKGEQVLSVELTGIGLVDNSSGNISYSEKPSALFDALYAQFVITLLPETFNAAYAINGNVLTLDQVDGPAFFYLTKEE